jgi:hypothetical protein
MKKIIFAIVLTMSSVQAAWNCRSIEGTVSLVKSQGCGDLRLCVGYAECLSEKDVKSVGRIICKANNDFSCPDANDCLDQAFNNKSITIGVQTSNDTRGVFRFCPSKNEFVTNPSHRSDAVNSRFCNTASGEYTDKIGETVSGMTGVNGGGAQTGHTK